MRMAGMNVQDIDYFDIYSCFPSAVAIARDSLGIGRDAPRPLTVTGGLPFHGGAGNNYVMNAVATMAERLRTDHNRIGMVTANGGYVSKHSVGIYSTAPAKPESWDLAVAPYEASAEPGGIVDIVECSSL